MTQMSDMDVCVVDVCGTLVIDDTTLGLLKHHFGRDGGRRLRSQLLKAMTARRSPLRVAFLVAEKITGKHLLKRVAVRMLSGDGLAKLNESAADYASILLATRRIPSVWAELEGCSNTVLASASLEPIVASLASRMGVRYVASTLEHVNGVLTGRYARDLTGSKPQALLEKYGDSALAGRLGVISDNYSDMPLLEMAEKACVVLHNERHRERWRTLRAVYLSVDK